ncbi:MAG: hypothetical protein IH830_12215 [Planctomycetes bacterium]|nr:hypothetical protein [Planctomycetota bacterium]
MSRTSGLLANAILSVLSSVLGVVTLPVQCVTTFVLGILVRLTFGLLLLPISLVWVIVFLGPLLGTSWLWDKMPLLRLPLAMIGIPLALLASVYVCLMPSMGEFESRYAKLRICWTWPFSLDYVRYSGGKLDDDDRKVRIQRVMDTLPLNLRV